MKTPILFSLVLTGVAGAAFYAGVKYGTSGETKIATSKNAALTAQSPLAGAGGKRPNAVGISKDAVVQEFYKQYGLETGVPLTPDAMKEAMLTAIRESDPVRSQLMFARLMEELTVENAPAALGMIRDNVSGFDSMRYVSMLAAKWGEVDPVTAMKELAKGDDRGGKFVQSLALTGWAAKDPAAAIAWAANSDANPWEKGMMTNQLINGLARSSPEEAAKFAADIKDPGERSRAAESIARELIRAGGADKAQAWVAGITDPDMKRGAFQTLSDQLLRSDPAKAAELIKASANEEYARGAVGNLASTLAKKDLQQGLALAGELNGQAQAKAYSSVVREWVSQNDGANAVDAAKYVEAMPAGVNKDSAVREIAQQAVRDDPATAIAWVSSIQDPAKREETMIDVARRYLRQDPEAGTAWLATSGLSEEARKKVRENGPGGWGGFPGGGGPGGGGFRPPGR
jgi:hypothetical protein